jgi:hypothetical protein
VHYGRVKFVKKSPVQNSGSPPNSPISAGAKGYAQNVQKLYKAVTCPQCSAADLDFRIIPNSVAVDRVAVLPNITDGFSGRAPDLGALGIGQASPHYELDHGT